MSIRSWWRWNVLKRPVYCDECMLSRHITDPEKREAASDALLCAHLTARYPESWVRRGIETADKCAAHRSRNERCGVEGKYYKPRKQEAAE